MTPPQETALALPPSLPADRLYRRCDPQALAFETTDEVEPLEEVVGQPRASEALRFGIGMRAAGYHIFALGPEESDRRGIVRRYLRRQAAGEPRPGDLCYVNDFDQGHCPDALYLPAGIGGRLSRDLDRCLEELKPALQGAFESEEYQTRRQGVQEEVGEEHEADLEGLREEAAEKELALLRTPGGFAFAPVKDGDVVPPPEFDRLPEAEREELKARIEGFQERLQAILRQLPRRQREVRERMRELNREVARRVVRDLFAELRSEYAEYDAVLEHLDACEEDIVDNVRQLVGGQQQEEDGRRRAAAGAPTSIPGGAPELRRYRVNVLVDHAESEHAPVLYEDHPTYQNLLGRVEFLPVMGALVTDFNMIRAGSLHRANGGYLVVDAHRLLTQPFAWEGLKRALQSGELRIESPREAMGLVSTVSVEPEPMPLQVKVVLLGDRVLYYLLSQLDPDFPQLFKVAADFADEMDRTPEDEALYARLVATMVKENELRPFDGSAVARVIERSARLAGDGEKLTAHTREVLDLLRQASHWAGEDGAEVVGAGHVQQAIDHWIYRSDRIRERVQEGILRDDLYIDTEGAREGQVNGLSVLQLGGFAFGRPSRITARVRLGSGEVVDIEREVEMAGPIHSKGVLILQGFLGGRYATERPLSLSASLVFEQSYSGVEGDSASAAELFALLSAIAEVPLRQSIAVTGSVNQHGEIQPIGGVNEKVEGFFDVCAARGLTGEQGVIVPAPNVKHLMLRGDVRQAAQEGRFHLWAIETVDEGMELLTGRRMGERDEEGEFPEDSINGRIADRLTRFAELRRQFGPAAGRDGRRNGDA